MAGGAVMEDFDNDGLLDLAVTSLRPDAPMAFYHNTGDGTFEDRTEAAGLTEQLGGMNLRSDRLQQRRPAGSLHLRGRLAALPDAARRLLRNNGDGTFTDVTRRGGAAEPVNSTASCWADYDNDGWLDVFVVCERQPNRLYHNRGNGTFEEVAARAGVGSRPAELYCKGANWIDYDNDDYPDLFVDNLNGDARALSQQSQRHLQRRHRARWASTGPQVGFSCWAWDYDNDGWLDIFATCYDYSLDDVVKGLLGQPHDRLSNRLFHNVQGQGLREQDQGGRPGPGLRHHGEQLRRLRQRRLPRHVPGHRRPGPGTLVPNRMFKNVGGKRFAEITASSGTGHLQKGHGVACGDWDRDGDVDLFIEMGGAVHGDRYHNILFQNPGQGNHWLTVKLVGKKTNRAAIGARIKVVTGGRAPADDPPARLLGQQLGGQPAPADDRPGQGRAGRRAGNPLADQRDDPGLPRHRRRPGHRGDRVRRRIPQAGQEGDSVSSGRAPRRRRNIALGPH